MPRGGKRKGAGRPKANTVRILVSIKLSTLKKIDKLRDKAGFFWGNAGKSLMKHLAMPRGGKRRGSGRPKNGKTPIYCFLKTSTLRKIDALRQEHSPWKRRAQIIDEFFAGVEIKGLEYLDLAVDRPILLRHAHT